MKEFLTVIFLCLLIIGCASNPNKDRAAINAQKINLVSKVAYQTDKALINTNVPLAKSYNDKVLSIAGMPEVKDMAVTNFDKEIISVQAHEDKVDLQIEANSEKAIALQTELNGYTRYWGLGGVVKGLGRFLTHSFWALIIIGIVFIVLRVLSTVNPAFGVAFSLFNTLGSMVIHFISFLTPKALSAVKSIEQSALTKVVDSIQSAKEAGKADVGAIQGQLAKVLSDKEKNLVSQIKQNLNY